MERGKYSTQPSAPLLRVFKPGHRHIYTMQLLYLSRPKSSAKSFYLVFLSFTSTETELKRLQMLFTLSWFGLDYCICCETDQLTAPCEFVVRTRSHRREWLLKYFFSLSDFCQERYSDVVSSPKLNIRMRIFSQLKGSNCTMLH